ncbi:ParB/RepB/Spo0J family partition protein [Aeromicrobium marinum]|nr:DNA methyltransferase [Aeromicrobium marinum]
MSPPEESAPYQLLPPLTPTEFEALKADIQARGVQVAIEFDEHGNVLDGHHRLRACREIGLKRFPRVVRAGMTDDEKREHALALNAHRRHLTRADRRRLVADLRELGWSIRRIAAATSTSVGTVTADLSVVQIRTPGVVVGSDGKQYKASRPRRPTSVLVTTERQQQAASEALVALGERAPAAHTDLRRLERLRRDQRSAEARQASRDASRPLIGGAEIRHCSIRDLTIPPGAVSLVLTDPPYSGADVQAGIYRDLAEFAGRVLAPGGWLVAYSPTMFLPQVLTDLSTSGLTYWWQYVIVFPQHPVQQRTRALASAYRSVVVFRQPGDTSLPAFTVDVLPGAGRAKDTSHPWQQAAGETRPLIEALTEPGDFVVDPFCGTGSFGLDATGLGRRFIGADIDAGHVDLARSRLADGSAGPSRRTTDEPAGR